MLAALGVLVLTASPFFPLLLLFVGFVSVRARDIQIICRQGCFTIWLARMTLPRDARLVILFMYAMVSQPRPAILVYLRRRRRSSATDAMLLRAAEDVLLATSEAQFQALMQDESEWVAQRSIARRMLAEQALYEWCKQANENGVAPSTLELLREAQRHRCDLPSSAFSTDCAGRMKSAARVWANSWRRRWRVRLGVIKGADVLTREELLQKARRALSLDRVRNHISGPIFEPAFQYSAPSRIYMLGRFALPLSGQGFSTRILIARRFFLCNVYRCC